MTNNTSERCRCGSGAAIVLSGTCMACHKLLRDARKAGEEKAQALFFKYRDEISISLTDSMRKLSAELAQQGCIDQASMTLESLRTTLMRVIEYMDLGKINRQTILAMTASPEEPK